jgi:hypothetical protein
MRIFKHTIKGVFMKNIMIVIAAISASIFTTAMHGADNKNPQTYTLYNKHTDTTVRFSSQEIEEGKARSLVCMDPIRGPFVILQTKNGTRLAAYILLKH